MSFYCIRCLRSWTRKESHDKHFTLQNISSKQKGSGGSLLPNPCFGKTKTTPAKSISEAKMLKKQAEKPITALFSRRLQPVEIDRVDNVGAPHDQEDQDPALEEGEQDTQEYHAEPGGLERVNEEGANFQEQGDQQQQYSLDDSESAASHGEETAETNISATFDQLQTIKKQIEALDSNQKLILKEIQSLRVSKQLKPECLSVSSGSKEEENSVEHSLNLIKFATSMQQILENELVRDIFRDDGSQLACCACELHINRIHTVLGLKYSHINYEKKDNERMAVWFTVFKKALRKHLKSPHHVEFSALFLLKQEKVKPLKVSARRSVRYLAYYLIQSNTAFSLWLTLLGVAKRCECIIGNLNHSSEFVTRLTDHINEFLIDNTVEWFNIQNNITITLDIGTCMGLVLLVTIIIGDDGVTKLAGCDLTASKKGKDVADLSWKTLTVGCKIPEETARDKVRGYVADGALVKDNEKFKDRCRELLQNPNLTFKWDILHLANRAHLEARGKTSYEEEHEKILAPDLQQDDQRNNENDVVRSSSSTNSGDRVTLAELLGYVQSTSKKWRSGIAYTSIKMTDVNFKRPKIWSSTRMSVYEFEQIKRFLECRLYWDVPWKYEVLSVLYCPVLFALRIILRKVQRTDVSPHYINRVFKAHDGLDPDGKSAMKLALKSIVDIIKGRSIVYLIVGVDNTDILNSEAEGSENTFSAELFHFLRENQAIFSIESERDTRAVTRNDHRLNLEDLIAVVEGFVHNFWECIDKRMAHTDTDCEVTSFSEAPAESFFSIYERIVDGRPSLLPRRVVSLARIMLEGPSPGTIDSHDITRAALAKWEGHLGERCTTANWDGLTVSKSVSRCVEKKWKFKPYSNVDVCPLPDS